MNYVIFDMEWNQALYSNAVIREPFPLYGEIIRIGAVKADDSFAMVDTFQAAIKPKHYKKMNRNVKRITHIYNEDLKVGVSFEDAVSEFRSFCGEECIFLTWGDNDVDMLCDNLRFFGVDASWVPPYYNLQKIFDMQFLQKRRACSLSGALEILGEEGLPDHNAFYDALDTYQVVKHLDMVAGMAALDEAGTTSYFVDSENCDLEKVCESSAAMKSDEELRTVICKECGKEVIAEKWVSQGAGKVIAEGHCEEGHGWFLRLNYNRNEDGSRRVRRMVYPLTEEKAAILEKHIKLAKAYAEKQKKNRRRNSKKSSEKSKGIPE
ncbi:MAG: exonuclease domain-containing protein [Firmicutes bacterium]|nr:exonuclease domain-containing protein [Bacillota bacterium]